MAQIDPSIPLNIQQANPIGAFQTGLQSAQQEQAQQTENKFKQFQLSSLMKEQQRQDEFANALKASGGDINKAMPYLMKIDPSSALTLQGKQIEQQKNQADIAKAVQQTETSKLEAVTKVHDLTDQALNPILQLWKTKVANGANPQQAQAELQPQYLMAMQNLAKSPEMAPYIGQMPTTFNPQEMDAKRQASMSFTDQAKMELENRKLKETQRYHSEIVGLKRDELSQKKEALLDDATINQMASQYLAGDKSVMQNLGRGAQGAQNIVKLRQSIRKQAEAQGLSGAQVAAKMAEFEGTKAGERTLGTRTANIEMAVNEAYNLADQALKTSASVPRTEFKSLNDMALAIKRGTGDEATARFYAAHNAFVNAASRAISPSGTPTVNDKEHVREILDKGYSQGQYQAAVDQIKKEMEQARKSPGQVKKEFREGVTGESSGDVINFDELPE